MTLTLLGMGFILGLKHALDADHIAAVTTIVSRQKSISVSSRIGMFWGIGHTVALLASGVLLLSIDRAIPEDIGAAIEFAVAVVLIAIGVNVLRNLFTGGRIHFHPHRHGNYVHVHPHVHRDSTDHHSPAGHPVEPGKSGWASFFLGMLHGLAGSGTLMLLVVATIPDFWDGLLYIAVFGVGSIGGMLTMSMLVSIPFVFTQGRFQHANTVVCVLAGAASIVVGITMGVEIGTSAGFFG
jgi:sulfite exporter TauE/SafE